MHLIKQILDIYISLSKKVDELKFSEPVTEVYNPLDYAWNGFESYITKFLSVNVKNVFLGMNPGPWGMAQTGVPFGEVNFVREWLNLKNIIVNKPENENADYKIEGLNCRRSEISGKKLWGLFKERFITTENFFSENIVLNYCPLLFMTDGKKSIRNLTPDKLKMSERKLLFEICNESLKNILEIIKPDFLIGIGNFAASRLNEVNNLDSKVVKILHPSPASPLSAKNWDLKVTEQLINSGVWR